MDQILLIVFLALGGSAVGSVKIINQGNEALVERLGSYKQEINSWPQLCLAIHRQYCLQSHNS